MTKLQLPNSHPTSWLILDLLHDLNCSGISGQTEDDRRLKLK